MRGLALVVTFAAAALGAGCGFHLRGSATYAFSSIHVASPPTLPFTQELKRAPSTPAPPACSTCRRAPR